MLHSIGELPYNQLKDFIEGIPPISISKKSTDVLHEILTMETKAHNFSLGGKGKKSSSPNQPLDRPQTAQRRSTSYVQPRSIPRGRQLYSCEGCQIALAECSFSTCSKCVMAYFREGRVSACDECAFKSCRRCALEELECRNRNLAFDTTKYLKALECLQEVSEVIPQEKLRLLREYFMGVLPHNSPSAWLSLTDSANTKVSRTLDDAEEDDDQRSSTPFTPKEDTPLRGKRDAQEICSIETTLVIARKRTGEFCSYWWSPRQGVQEWSDSSNITYRERLALEFDFMRGEDRIAYQLTTASDIEMPNINPSILEFSIVSGGDDKSKLQWNLTDFYGSPSLYNKKKYDIRLSVQVSFTPEGTYEVSIATPLGYSSTGEAMA